MPTYLGELLTAESIKTIIDGYTTGPRADGRKTQPLQTDVPDDFLTSQDDYDYGGIVFCPHKDNTGVAVFTNQSDIEEKHPNTQIGTFVGSNDDEEDERNNKQKENKREEDSFANLELFRDNKIPLMIATKAFGMGIDKPNVRYTINLNYSSSLESFVQEAGGRYAAPPPATVRITRTLRVYVGEQELKIRPMAKTVLLLFLRHPEGIVLKHIGDYRSEMATYYGRVMRSLNPSDVDRRIQRLLDIFSNELNVNISRVNSALSALVSPTEEKLYRVGGRAGKPKSIPLDRTLVIWE